MNEKNSLRTTDLSIGFGNENSLEIWDEVRNERLFIIPDSKLFLPQFAEKAVLVRSEVKETSITLFFQEESLLSGKIVITKTDPGFSIQGEFIPAKDEILNRLNLTPAGTWCSCWHVENFRNVCGTENLIPEVTLQQPFDINTYSEDWQFAPHPTAMLFSRNSAKVILGATCAPLGGYGLYLKGAKYVISDFYLNYGDSEWGMCLPHGKTWKTPLFRLALVRTNDPYEAWADFGCILIREGFIPDPAKRTVYPWHKDDVYCTWIDQCFLSKYVPDADLKVQSMYNASRSWMPLTESMVRESVQIIKREKLPLKTILIDGGWMRTCGDFYAAPSRFPEMRKLVDELHAEGFRVIVWWSWAEVRDQAGADAIGKHNLILDGKLNRHHRVMCDYSKKSTQEEYFKPLLRRFFSSEPDCYDFDGIKTDYQADKVHFDLPAADPEWRGEENYFQHLYQLFYTEMKKYKPDAQHIGCAGNYFLAQYMDTNRTYDVCSDNPLEHANRVKMLRATAPGVLPVVDMTKARTALFELVRVSREMDVPIHIGNLRALSDDLSSEYTPMTESDFNKLRKGLTPLS